MTTGCVQRRDHLGRQRSAGLAYTQGSAGTTYYVTVTATASSGYLVSAASAVTASHADTSQLNAPTAVTATTGNGHGRLIRSPSRPRRAWRRPATPRMACTNAAMTTGCVTQTNFTSGSQITGLTSGTTLLRRRSPRTSSVDRVPASHVDAAELSDVELMRRGEPMRRFMNRGHRRGPDRHGAARPTTGDQGSVLILALVYLTAVSISVLALGGLVLDEPAHHQRVLVGPRAPGCRAQHDRARDAEHPLRTACSTPTQNASPPVACWGSGATSGLTSIDGYSMNVWCSTVWNPTSGDTRVVTFSTCQSTVTRHGLRGEPVPPGCRHLRRLPTRRRGRRRRSVHRLELVRPGDDGRQLDLGVGRRAGARQPHRARRKSLTVSNRNSCDCVVTTV